MIRKTLAYFLIGAESWRGEVALRKTRKYSRRLLSAAALGLFWPGRRKSLMRRTLLAAAAAPLVYLAVKAAEYPGAAWPQTRELEW